MVTSHRSAARSASRAVALLAAVAASLVLAQACTSPAADPQPQPQATASAKTDGPAGVPPTPVELHGQLRVEGNRLVDACGRHVQLAGVSHFWHTWEGREHWNADAVEWLRDDWRVSLIRAPLAAHPGVEGDYLTAPDSSLAQLRRLVEGAIEHGMYVVVDFHTHHPYPAEAVELLGTIARDYGHLPNVLYAIWNEPEGQQTGTAPLATWRGIKAYAKTVVPAIRAHDPDNVVIVPTPFYDQFPEFAHTHPLTAGELGASTDNLMYDVHFYAGQHKGTVRDRTRRALTAGVPIIITEVGRVGVDWGPDNQVDSASFDAWMRFVDSNRISFTKWSLSTKLERSSSLRPGAAARGHWTEADLTPEGRFNRGFFRERGERFYAQAPCPAAHD